MKAANWGRIINVCGPKPFMDGVKDVALPSWPAESIHIEGFSPDLEALTSPAKAFEVMLARSGRSYLVPEDKTITDCFVSRAS